MIMSVLSGNLVEGQQEKSTQMDESPIVKKDVRATIEAIRTDSQVTTETGQEQMPKVHVFLKFNFTMDELIINLYSGGVKLVKKFNES